MDITLHILYKPSGVDLSSNPEKEARVKKPGDVVLVYDRSAVKEKPNPKMRMAFIHIFGANLSFNEAQNLTRRKTERSKIFRSNGLRNSDIMIFNNVWRFNFENLPESNINELESSRETVVSWLIARPLILNKHKGTSLIENEFR